MCVWGWKDSNADTAHPDWKLEKERKRNPAGDTGDIPADGYRVHVHMLAGTVCLEVIGSAEWSNKWANCSVNDLSSAEARTVTV